MHSRRWELSVKVIFMLYCICRRDKVTENNLTERRRIEEVYKGTVEPAFTY